MGRPQLGKHFSIAVVSCQASSSPFVRFPTVIVHRLATFSLLSEVVASAPLGGGQKERRNNLKTVLPKRNRVSLRTRLVHRPREGRFSAEAELGPPGYATAVSASLRQRNSVPSTHMRCMTTARRRARATIAFLAPRRRATCMPQALSQDHVRVRVRSTCAAS